MQSTRCAPQPWLPTPLPFTSLMAALLLLPPPSARDWLQNLTIPAHSPAPLFLLLQRGGFPRGAAEPRPAKPAGLPHPAARLVEPAAAAGAQAGELVLVQQVIRQQGCKGGAAAAFYHIASPCLSCSASCRSFAACPHCRYAEPGHSLPLCSCRCACRWCLGCQAPTATSSGHAASTIC